MFQPPSPLETRHATNQRARTRKPNSFNAQRAQPIEEDAGAFGALSENSQFTSRIRAARTCLATTFVKGAAGPAAGSGAGSIHTKLHWM